MLSRCLPSSGLCSSHLLFSSRSPSCKFLFSSCLSSCCFPSCSQLFTRPSSLLPAKNILFPWHSLLLSFLSSEIAIPDGFDTASPSFHFSAALNSGLAVFRHPPSFSPLALSEPFPAAFSPTPSPISCNLPSIALFSDIFTTKQAISSPEISFFPNVPLFPLHFHSPHPLCKKTLPIPYSSPILSTAYISYFLSGHSVIPDICISKIHSPS